MIIKWKFVSYFLNKQWLNFWFSRTNRASIDRIEWIKIFLLWNLKQYTKIEKIESEIEILENSLKAIPERKRSFEKVFIKKWIILY